MIKSFTGKEFAKALTDGTLNEPIVKIGMVKKDEGRSSAILFAEGFTCAHWIKIPLDLIEEVKHLSTIQCRDHEHPLVQISFKEPANQEARVFAQLARGISSRPSFAQTSAPASRSAARGVFHWIEPLPEETEDPTSCARTCARFENLCNFLGDSRDCSHYYNNCINGCR